MRNERKQAGVTLVEMTVVVAIAALMVGLTIPVANMLLNSFESESGAKSIISSALASARAIAAKEQRYAGIRFQKRYDPANPDPLKASQYIIFIVKDDLGNLANGFRAVDGIQPIKLPDSIGVMDLEIRTNWVDASMNGIGDRTINDNTLIDSPAEVNATSTFSIIFSPSGKIVTHVVTVRNRDGVPTPDNSDSRSYKHSMDDIFNSPTNITNYQIGMFAQDDYAGGGYGSEFSRNNFIIYDTKKFKQVPYNNRWDGYLKQIAQKPVYINPYTGTIINER